MQVHFDRGECFFFFKQKTAYEMRISDWSSDVCSSDLWNFLFIGATTLVTTCYRPNERGKAQALNDFLIFGTTALSSFMAGYLVEHLGWHPLDRKGVV